MLENARRSCTEREEIGADSLASILPSPDRCCSSCWHCTLDGAEAVATGIIKDEVESYS
jgi:hypothetical protein